MTPGDVSHQHLSKCPLRYELTFVFKEGYCGYVGDVSMTIISYILLHQQLEDGGRDKSSYRRTFVIPAKSPLTGTFNHFLSSFHPFQLLTGWSSNHRGCF